MTILQDLKKLIHLVQPLNLGTKFSPLSFAAVKRSRCCQFGGLTAHVKLMVMIGKCNFFKL